MPCMPALRTNSSRSSKWYAGSNELAAFAGRFSAIRDQYTVVRTIPAFAFSATSKTSWRSSRHRRLGSSWKPTSMRGSAEAMSGNQRGGQRAGEREQDQAESHQAETPWASGTARGRLAAPFPDPVSSYTPFTRVVAAGALSRRAPLLVQPPLPRRRRRLRRPALSLAPSALAERLDEPFDRQLAVAPLAALVLRDGAQRRPRTCRSTRRFWASVSADGGLDVENRLDARLRALRVLPAGPAGAGKAQLISSSGECRPSGCTRIDSAAHGGHSARPRRRAARLRGADPRRGRRRSRELRRQGHRLRFVTNNTTRAARDAGGGAARLRDRARRRRAADDRRAAAARALAGKRVLRARDGARSSRTWRGSSSSARAPRPCCSAAPTRPRRPAVSSAT